MENREEKSRHEYKYPISDIEAAVLRERLRAVMRVDSHVGENGRYKISSLYFDDERDSCFYENENGTDPREKFRIRIYNNSADRISLECKRKEKGKTLKTSCVLTKEETQAIIDGKKIDIKEGMHPLLLKFVKLQNTRKLRPKVIVEYERIPYVYRLGNVRITLDSNLVSSHCVDKFLSGGYIRRPVMPVGTQLLEVKFDEFLPDYFYEAMQLGNLTQTAFSKYYLCRKYSSR